MWPFITYFFWRLGPDWSALVFRIVGFSAFRWYWIVISTEYEYKLMQDTGLEQLYLTLYRIITANKFHIIQPSSVVFTWKLSKYNKQSSKFRFVQNCKHFRTLSVDSIYRSAQRRHSQPDQQKTVDRYLCDKSFLKLGEIVAFGS